MSTDKRARFSDGDEIHGEVSPSPPNSSQYLSTINSQLIIHGWAKRPLNLESLPEKDHNEVVTVLFELLGSSVSNLTKLESLAARHRTLEYENERSNKGLTALQKTNARLEGETESWKSRCLDLEKRLGLADEREKGLREELARGRKALDGVRVAASHENKKSQLKLDKAQAQLVKISMDSTLTSRPQGMLLLNPISGGRSHPVAHGNSPLLEQSLRDLVEIRQSLQEETEAFRHVIVSTGNGLREALAAGSGEEAPQRQMHPQFFSLSTSRATTSSNTYTTHQSSSSTSHPSIADQKLRHLISLIRERLVSPLPPSIKSGEATSEPEDTEGKEREARERERVKRDLEDRIKDLEVELGCCKGREEEANRLVEEFAKVQLQVGSRAIEESSEEEEAAQSLRKEKILFDEERKKFTEATLRLGQERLKLETQRQAFLEEQRQKDLETMLAYLPSTPPPISSTTPPSSEIPSPFLSSTSTSTAATQPQTQTHAHLTHPLQTHKPKLPSPLSPFTKPRTPKPKPKAHLASSSGSNSGGSSSARRKSGKPKTPLSRLVLEKAVREKGKVLGDEGGRRTNGLSTSVMGNGKGKGKDVEGRNSISTTSSASSSKETGRVESFVKGGENLRTSTSAKGLTTSQRGLSVAPMTRDLSKAEGIGPRNAARGTKVWR